MSGIRKMFDAAPPDAVNLGLGEPDFNPPEMVKEALFQAVREGFNKYGPTRGIIPLRDTIARIYEERYGPASRDNVMISVGGSEALAVAALTLYEAGDEVLVPDPGFVLYAQHARMADARPVFYSLKESNAFLPDFDELESKITRRTTALVVNSPSNPTGTVFPRKVVDRLVKLALDHDLTIISDEVYDQIQYLSEPYTSFWGRLDKVIVVNSFSKIFAMTGWRLGYMLGEKEFLTEADKIHYHLVACAPTPPQIAALKGLQDGAADVAAMVREFRHRRDFIVKYLRSIPGMHCVPPTGAFYAFPSFDWDMTDVEAAHGLLQRGLLCTPGSAFGSLGKGHLRFSFANSRENIGRAMTILSEFAHDLQ